MINYTELSKQLEVKTADMSKSEQFSYALLFLWRTSYGYGRENIIQSDCSGLLSAAFYLTGIDIRVTADTFYNEVFVNRDNFNIKGEVIKAYFVIDQESRRAVHVAPVIENGVCLDTQMYAEIIPFTQFYSRYDTVTRLVLWRTTNWSDVLRYSKNTRCVYGLDPELKRLRKV